ncbi:hypothetical protein CSC68_12490 [Pseudoxanthomonas suwonensis]|nr:hypothetical protein CSC68_12490 [Pseudoxanthomonas suwonensis]
MSRHDPLSPEELELRRQLEAAAGPGPSPGLDARILAAARGQAPAGATGPAAAPSPLHRRRARPRRWIAPLSLAASLVLAFGVAWQLREPPAPGQARQADRPATGPAGTSPEAPAAAILAEPREVQPADARATEDVPSRADTGATVPPAAVSSLATSAVDSGGPQPPLREEASAAMARAPLPAAPAPDTVTAAPMPAPAPDAGASAYAETTRAAGDIARARQAQDAARVAAERARRQARTMRPAAAAALPKADHAPPAAPPAPPAPVAAPAVQAGPQPPVAVAVADPQEWLELIRDLQADGDIEGARASLEWFVREHPGLEVPGDLRPLLDHGP